MKHFQCSSKRPLTMWRIWGDYISRLDICFNLCLGLIHSWSHLFQKYLSVRHQHFIRIKSNCMYIVFLEQTSLRIVTDKLMVWWQLSQIPPTWINSSFDSFICYSCFSYTTTHTILYYKKFVFYYLKHFFWDTPSINHSINS